MGASATATGVGTSSSIGGRPGTGVSSGFGTPAREGATTAGALTGPPARLGSKPQSWPRSRDRRGTQLTVPEMPARMKAQPSLSTYWVPS